MGRLEQAMDFFSTVEGIHSTWGLSDEEVRKILEIEGSVLTQNNQEYENVGCKVVAEKEHRFCAFYTDEFQHEYHPRVVLTCDDGTIMGKTIFPEEMEEYRGRTDVIWVSEDFVVFPETVGTGEERFVLYPFEIPQLIRSGFEGAIGASPTVISDTYLKGLHNLPVGTRLFSLIIGFDG